MNVQISLRNKGEDMIVREGASGIQDAHPFRWRDAMDIIVKWRQLAEPNDQVNLPCNISCQICDGSVRQRALQQSDPPLYSLKIFIQAAHISYCCEGPIRGVAWHAGFSGLLLQ